MKLPPSQTSLLAWRERAVARHWGGRALRHGHHCFFGMTSGMNKVPPGDVSMICRGFGLHDIWQLPHDDAPHGQGARNFPVGPAAFFDMTFFSG
jgi:hypothetical protein